MSSTKIAEEIAELLLGINAITINASEPFRYSSGILSPCYSDMRLLMSYPAERRKVITAWVELIKELGQYDLVAATATAGIPHGAWVSDALNIPMVYVRDKAKGHGKQNQIEGLVKKGQKVVVVEDLISTGKSSLATLQAIREQGGNIDTISAIFNYTLPQSAENLSAAGVTLKTLTTFPTVVDIATKKKLIKESDRELVLDWVNDPAAWGAKHGYE